MRRFLTTFVLCMASGVAIAADPTQRPAVPDPAPTIEEAFRALGPTRKPLNSSPGIASSRIYIPAAANTAGRFGAYFKTKTTIFNTSVSAAQVTAKVYTPNGSGGTFTTTVPAAQAVTWENMLESLGGYVGGGGVLFSTPFTSQKLIVTSEVYVDGPNGRYSTPTEAWNILDFVGSTYLEFTVGVNVNDSFRTNLACMNDGFSSETVFADVYSPAGPFIGRVSITIPADGWSQQVLSFPVTNGVVIWRAPSVFQFCYASVVHNVSNDGTFLSRAAFVP